MDVGLRWEPMWTSSSVYDSEVRRTKDALCRPFHRMILEFFSIEILDKSTVPGATSDGSLDCRSRCWPFQSENLEWASRYITPTIFLFLLSAYHLPSKGWRWPRFYIFFVVGLAIVGQLFWWTVTKLKKKEEKELGVGAWLLAYQAILASSSRTELLLFLTWLIIKKTTNYENERRSRIYPRR